ncbi:hypothetical protein AXFE_20380 [Acidithrix ferrooxidans]|uniref:Transposase IS4-like domain-containing protein n=1 Tax=Acidithrix ferrooxidans TaxID=1280514 RepID=A0A0D8HGK5_9ACTN|nr:hypothetical protein AXFE_20380 [Acidithrix ferrooxidans]
MLVKATATKHGFQLVKLSRINGIKIHLILPTPLNL